ncbi:hypothetical protein [Alkalisalibacterium limincola]|uniref:hypothetical protein n=1 Tax=Alkalisalibacterium limincola TaxID=2699169 RepID=UPI0021048AFD|nr:hypothetical protein [Alkalisalibacterium limincola]
MVDVDDGQCVVPGRAHRPLHEQVEFLLHQPAVADPGERVTSCDMGQAHLVELAARDEDHRAHGHHRRGGQEGHQLRSRGEQLLLAHRRPQQGKRAQDGQPAVGEQHEVREYDHVGPVQAEGAEQDDDRHAADGVGQGDQDPCATRVPGPPRIGHRRSDGHDDQQVDQSDEPLAAREAQHGKRTDPEHGTAAEEEDDG